MLDFEVVDEVEEPPPQWMINGKRSNETANATLFTMNSSVLLSQKNFAQ
jgi:hypothetical protein